MALLCHWSLFLVTLTLELPLQLVHCMSLWQGQLSQIPLFYKVLVGALHINILFCESVVFFCLFVFL